jgi:hypothetical protein
MDWMPRFASLITALSPFPIAFKERQMNRRLLLIGAAVVMVLSLRPGTARAQTGLSGIAGVVRDTSGAVLPGVTVEAASPALIEKVRSVVTSGRVPTRSRSAWRVSAR